MIRVLHVVENFNGQAVESWLTRLVTHGGYNTKQLHFDFFLLGIGQGKRAGDVLNCGCKLIKGNSGGASIPQMARALRRVVRLGNYHVVHIHQDVLGGVFAFALTGLRVHLIVQAHNCWQRLPVGGVLKELILTACARWLAQLYANALVGVSCQSLSAMTSNRERRGRIDRVIYCSAKVPCNAPDMKARTNAASAIKLRYHLPESAKLLLFLGRLDNYKNPQHALDLLFEILTHGAKNVHLIVGGAGGLESTLRKMAAEQGIESYFHFVGWVDEPKSLLLAADLLVMPSQEICGEGLGLAAVEAQALGTPVLCSLSIPEDAKVIPALFRRISLSEDIGSWRSAAGELLVQGSADPAACWDAFQRSPFTDTASYMGLASLYEELVGTGTGPESRPH